MRKFLVVSTDLEDDRKWKEEEGRRGIKTTVAKVKRATQVRAKTKTVATGKAEEKNWEKSTVPFYNDIELGNYIVLII